MHRPIRTITAAALCAGLLWAPLARADFKVWRPDVQEGAVEVEVVGDLGFDRHAAQRGEQYYTGEVATGVNSWWLTEFAAEAGRAPGPGQATYVNQVTTENLFAFTERGEGWIDFAWYAEFGHSLQKGQPSEVTLGPVLRKDLGATSDTLNLFVTRTLGSGRVVRPSLLAFAESRIDGWTWRLADRWILEPGFQVYLQHGALTRPDGFDLADRRVGPQLYGKILNIGPGTLEWNGGVLVGLNSSTPKLTVRWQLEYEFH